MSSNPLQEQLLRDCRETPITFRDFMARCLYDPEHGYYASGRAQVGKDGDFYTSVSVGPLFGQLLARQFVEVWHALGCPAHMDLAEQGAHDGKLMADVLSWGKANQPEWYDALRVWMIEPFALRRQEQQATLNSHADKVGWVPDLRTVKRSTWKGVFYCNELLDALPVHLMLYTGGQWKEMGVGVKDGRFEWVTMDCPTQDLNAWAKRKTGSFPEGYQTEACLDSIQWLEEATACFAQGMILIIDYGNSIGEQNVGTQGSIRGYRAHRREDGLLENPGEQDLTADVNFSDLAAKAQCLGAHIEGFTDQGTYLTGLARFELEKGEREGRPVERSIIRAFHSLTHPEMMGRRFKVLALGVGLPSGLTWHGFQFKSLIPAT